MTQRFTLLASAALLFLTMSACRGSADGAGAGGKPVAPVGTIELAGVDTSSLTPRERREWSQYVSEIMAPCRDLPVPIAQCVKESRPCSRCLPAARFVVKQVRNGSARDQVMEAYKMRFDSDRVKAVDVGDAPVKGPATAPVTIVEWADFQCPFCKRASPLIEEVMAKFPGKVRLAFKNYPLSAHPLAEPAARAVLAAQAQNKFWEMHHKLFEVSPEGLEPPGLEAAAKEVGLNVDTWKKDMASDGTAARLTREKKQAEALNFMGTPLIYINGREFALKGDFPTELEEWIRQELDFSGSTPEATGSAPVVPSRAAP